MNNWSKFHCEVDEITKLLAFIVADSLNITLPSIAVKANGMVLTAIYYLQRWTVENDSICKTKGCRYSMGWCMRQLYCPLSFAVCNATIPTLPLFEVAESAYSPFCYVLHFFVYKIYIDLYIFITYTWHAGQLL
jgi:hypothetical protein